jgi:hypothetical protein
VVVGGIIFSLILTLFVIPAIYTYLSGEHKYKDIEKSSLTASSGEINETEKGINPETE